MASDFLTSFKLYHIQALHDFVMMKMTEGLAIDLKLRWLAPLGNDLVVGLILGDGNIFIDQVTD